MCVCVCLCLSVCLSACFLFYFIFYLIIFICILRSKLWYRPVKHAARCGSKLRETEFLSPSSPLLLTNYGGWGGLGAEEGGSFLYNKIMPITILLVILVRIQEK